MKPLLRHQQRNPCVVFTLFLATFFSSPLTAFTEEHSPPTPSRQETVAPSTESVLPPEAGDDNEDTHHVIVFLPDGMTLEATGSVSGIQTRGNVRVTRHYQLNPTTGVVRFGDGQQGRRLPTTQSNISAQYREGSRSQGGAELSMIELQSVVSKRDTALALTTSLLNSLHGQFQLEAGTDRPGNDFARHLAESPESCRTRCAGEETCQAFTFVKPIPGSAQGSCFLKRSEPQPMANPCCVSGTRSSSQDKIIRNIGR